eukprot:jgi/Psemu1/62933/estExt_Genemark1.C_120124
MFSADVGGDGLQDDISLISGFDEEINFNDVSFNSIDSCSHSNNDICEKSNIEPYAIQNYSLIHTWPETTDTEKEVPNNIGNIGIGTRGNTLVMPPVSFQTRDYQKQQQSPCPTNSDVDRVSIRNIKPLDALLAQNGPSIAPQKSKHSSSSLKSDITTTTARGARLKNIMLKQSRSEGLLTRTLKAKYRNNTSRRRLSIYSANAQQMTAGMGEIEIPLVGKVNATWNTASEYKRTTSNSFSSAPYKAATLQDLLSQSTVKCRSQSLLMQSSAQSMSKRNSFQSIKNLNQKLDVSSLLPVKGYVNSRNASRRRSFPSVASVPPTTTHLSDFDSNNKNAMAQTNVDTDTCDPADSLLHQACRLFSSSDTVIEAALRFDADAVRRSIVVTNDAELSPSKKANNGLYGYPINIALSNGANTKVLKLLAESGPDVLAYKDGANSCDSLGAALSLGHCNLEVVDLLLSCNQQCARVADRRGNYPLHVAVSYGRSLEIVKRLYSVYPEAHRRRNFHSQTPIDIAVQSTRCPEEVTDFFRNIAFPAPCAVVTAGNKNEHEHCFGCLEDGLDDIMRINF